MYTGRLDLAFIHRAFEKGADGVFVGGCWPGECHYITEGNYDALGNVHLYKRLLRGMGLYDRRLQLTWLAASEGARYAQEMNAFVHTLKELGPVADGEGLDRGELSDRMAAVGKLIPYIKLVERQRLRPQERTEEATERFWADERTGRLFDEMVGDHLLVSRIVSLLGKGPRSIAQIAKELELEASDVSKHLGASSKKGLVQYDTEHGVYTLAGQGM